VIGEGEAPAGFEPAVTVLQTDRDAARKLIDNSAIGWNRYAEAVRRVGFRELDEVMRSGHHAPHDMKPSRQPRW
jgi:hypothetical protein